ncbi:MAG: DUF2500 domain-containing protein [Candidatus Onthomonas sp.]
MGILNGFFFGGGFEILFMVLFLLILAMFIIAFVRGISQWNKNNHSPRLTVEATVVSRRSNVTLHQHRNCDMDASMGIQNTRSTTYYVTFQVASGDRMEFVVTGGEYGMLVEGDKGQLSFQGTRYLGFQRQ